MKQRSTTPVSKRALAAKSSLVAVAVLMAVAFPMQMGNVAFADNYDEQISALQAEIGQYRERAAELSRQADTYQAALAKLNAETAQIEREIALNQTKHDKLVADIAENEKQIDANKDALGKTIADMYVDGSVSPLEMLASSKTIGDYVDKQEQQAAIQENLSATISRIDALKKQLEQQRVDVERTLADQASQRELLAQKQNEQRTLIDQTRGEESAYQQLSADRDKQVQQLRAEQAEANRRAMARASGGGSVNIPAGTPGGGGYPGMWANAPINAYVDPWGLYSRQCVSYVAWKIHSTGRHVPHFAGAGNANQWPGTAARHGIASGSTPRAGSAAVMNVGYYGHVMYVESVNGDGTITVSDYNLEWDGLYRQYTRSAAGLTYVYF